MKKNLKYPNLAAFFTISALTYFLYKNGFLEQIVNSLGSFGYFGAFIAGIFFVSTFTVVPAGAMLALFAGHLNIYLLSFVAGIGGVIGDYAIFRFIKDGMIEELKSVFHKVGGDNLLKFHWIIHTKYFAWLSPVIGAIIIASPF